MIKLKVEGKEYELASSWEEVTIKKYAELQHAINAEYSPIKQLIYFVSVLSGCPTELLYQISIDDLKQIDLDWINTKIVEKIEKIIEINGIKYGSVKDMKNLSLGEYVDLDEYTKDINSNMHKVCAVLMRPIVEQDGDLYIIEKYKSESVDARANIFLETMNVIQLYSLSNFFLNSATSYLGNLNPSSLQQVTKKVKKQIVK